MDAKPGRERVPSRVKLILEEYRLQTELFVRYFSGLNTDYIVLDVACGDGYHMELLRNLGFRRIYGVDTDEEMLEIAAEKGLNVRYGTPYELDIQGAFDVIIMCDLIGYLEDPELALNKINTALKESGILYLSAPVYESLAEKLSRRRRETRPGSMSSQQVIYLLEKSGFELEHKLHTANRLPLSSGRVQNITFGGRFGNWFIVIARKVKPPQITLEEVAKDEDVEAVRQNAEGNTVGGGDTEPSAPPEGRDDQETGGGTVHSHAAGSEGDQEDRVDNP